MMTNESVLVLISKRMLLLCMRATAWISLFSPEDSRIQEWIFAPRHNGAAFDISVTALVQLLRFNPVLFFPQVQVGCWAPLEGSFDQSGIYPDVRSCHSDLLERLRFPLTAIQAQVVSPWMYIYVHNTKSTCLLLPTLMSTHQVLAGLTATALAILLQELSLRTDTVVWSWSAHTLVLTAMLHCVAQIHICKYRVRKTCFTDMLQKPTVENHNIHLFHVLKDLKE